MNILRVDDGVFATGTYLTELHQDMEYEARKEYDSEGNELPPELDANDELSVVGRPRRKAYFTLPDQLSKRSAIVAHENRFHRE